MERDVVIELSEKYNRKEELIEIMSLLNKEEGINYVESKNIIEEYFADKLQTN